MYIKQETFNNHWILTRQYFDKNFMWATQETANIPRDPSTFRVGSGKPSPNLGWFTDRGKPRNSAHMRQSSARNTEPAGLRYIMPGIFKLGNM